MGANSRPWIVLKGAAALAALPSPARADVELARQWDEPLLLSTTSTLLLEYRHDNFDGKTLTENDRVLDLLGRLNARLTYGSVGASVRLDGIYLFHRGNRCPEGGCRVDLRDDLRVGQFSAWYRGAWLELVGGDVTVQFGRGLALSIRRVDEIGVDLALRGGRARLRRGAHTVTVVAGLTNHNEVDFATAEFIADPQDLIAGARYEADLAGFATLGAHYVFSDFNETPDPDGFIRYHIPGVSLEIPTLGEHLSLAFEGAYLRRDASTLVEGGTNGYALFAGLTGYFGPVTLLLEAKHYRRFRFGRNDKPALRYHEPPSLERFDQQVPNNDNVLGGRLRLTVDLRGGDTVPFVNLLAYALNDQVDESLLDGKNSRVAYHLYAGVEQKLGPASLKLSFGFREDRWLDPGKRDDSGAVTAHIKRRVFRTDGSLSVPLGRHSLDAKWEHRTELRPLFSSDVTFHKGRFTLTYGLGGWISLAALLSWDHDPDDDDPIQPSLLGGGEVTLHMGRQAMLKLFGGGLHGGLVCVSGSCRQLPSFLGARSELVLRF